MSEHVRVCPGELDACGCGELAQAAGGRMPVHPGAAAVEQDRAVHPPCGGTLDGPADRRRQRDQDDFAALAAHTKDTVTVLFA